MKAAEKADEVGTRYATVQELKDASAANAASYGGMEGDFEETFARLAKEVRENGSIFASNAASNTDTALQDFLAIAIGDRYGLTITAVSSVLVKMLNEAFNDVRSISRRAFKSLVAQRMQDEIAARQKEYSVLVRKMDALLEDEADDKMSAWDSLVDSRGSGALSASQKAEAKAMYESIVSTAIANGINADGTTWQRLLKIVSWDAFYWTLAGVTYDEAIALYPAEATDEKPVTFDQFIMLTGMTIRQESRITGIINSLQQEIENVLSNEKAITQMAIEYSDYYSEAEAFETYSQYVEDMLFVINEAYTIGNRGRARTDTANDVIFAKAAAYDVLMANNGSRTYTLPAARGGEESATRLFAIETEDYDRFAAWKDALVTGFDRKTESEAKAEVWDRIKSLYADGYRNLIAALKFVNNRAVEMLTAQNIGSIDYAPFVITKATSASYYSNIENVNEKYNLFNVGYYSIAFKAYVWEYLVDREDIESEFSSRFLSKARDYIINSTRKDEAYRYYAWSNYYNDVKGINENGYAYTIRRNGTYEVKDDFTYTITRTNMDVAGNTTWYLVAFEEELLTKLDTIYENARSVMPEKIIETANGVGTAQVGLLHAGNLISVRALVGNFDIKLAFVTAGLYLNEDSNKPNKPVYSVTTETYGSVKRYTQEFEEQNISDYIEELEGGETPYFADFGVDFKYVYADLSLDFVLDVEETSYRMKSLIDTIMSDLDMNIEFGGSEIGLDLVLKTLKDFDSHFSLKVEARVNVFDLMNEFDLSTTDIAITLYGYYKDVNDPTKTKEEKILQIALGSYIDEDGRAKNFVYVDLSRFNIQQLMIRDAIEYVRRLLGSFGAANAFAPYDVEYATSVRDYIGDVLTYSAFNDLEAKYAAAKAAGNIAELEKITIALKRSGLSARVGSGAIYALLGFFGFDVVEKYLSKAADVTLGLDIFAVNETLIKGKDEYDDSDRDLIRLAIKIDSLGENNAGSTGQGIEVDLGIHTINLSLDQNKFVLDASSNAQLEGQLDMPVDETTGKKLYAEVKEELPHIVLSTTLEFDFRAAQSAIAGRDINVEPISNILNSINEGLAGIIGRILFTIANGHEMHAAIDLYADISLGDGSDNEYLQHIINGSIVKIVVRAWHGLTGEITEEQKKKEWAGITYFDGDLYIDLEELHISKVKLSNAADLVFGSSLFAANAWNEIGETWAAAVG
ncbi:MAG: hypothetical protein IJ676_04320, partial [Clostridia bacterium]|nr:hypothetical protein [Clostridia bacterium]